MRPGRWRCGHWTPRAAINLVPVPKGWFCMKAQSKYSKSPISTSSSVLAWIPASLQKFKKFFTRLL